MKRIHVLTVLVLFIFLLSGFAQGQGFKITKPNAIGGNFVGTHLDGLNKMSSMGPGLEVFLKYNV